MPPIILAIDPGTTHSAWVAWDGTCVTGSSFDKNDEVLETIREHCSPSIRFACERIESYGMAVGREVFETCFWTGRFIQAAQPQDMELIPRLAVKSHLCQNARAKDTNIRQALIDRFGPVGTVKNPGPLFGISSHKWAALAVAVTFADQLAARETGLAAELASGLRGASYG